MTFILLLVTLVGLQVRFWVGDGGVREHDALQSTLELEKKHLSLLEDKNDTLDAEVKDLKHHSSAIEERARVGLGMIKKNERFYSTGH